jgi:1,2-phenylacetyl-CoA epoxidase catalytic subunit
VKKHNNTEPKLKLPTINESWEAVERAKAQHHPTITAMMNKHTQGPSRKGKERATKIDEEELANLRQGWHDKYQDILQGVPEELPPLRAVNHEINLIDPNKKYMYNLPRCPSSVRNEFQHKLNRYVNAQWWVPATGTQAAPLMCVPKKDR